MLSNLLVQLVNGLADASTLFLVAAGLSLIFGVTRIVNFAHGSFYMFGIYVAYTFASRFGHTVGGYWFSVLAAALVVAVLGALVEMIVLRRIYQAPELFHLLATFALVLIFRDAALWLWGPEDLFGPRSPHLGGAINLLGHPLPTYDIALIIIGPLVLLLLWYALTRTRWGTLVRAATQDREMLGALGINQAWLFTGVFFVGAFLAGLGGALQGPRMSANLSLDLETIGNAFVVVVVGGMGSIPGAFVAALLIAEIKALCIGIGHVSIGGIDFSLSRFTLVAEFVVMAVVLVVRPWGLFGRATAAVAVSAFIGGVANGGLLSVCERLFFAAVADKSGSSLSRGESTCACLATLVLVPGIVSSAEWYHASSDGAIGAAGVDRVCNCRRGSRRGVSVVLLS